jgi:hypothetical protein
MIDLGQDSVVCIATHYGLKVKERVELYLYSSLGLHGLQFSWDGGYV